MPSESPPSEAETYEAPAIIVDDAIVFPEMEVSMTVHEPRSVAAATQAMKEHNLVVVIPSPGLDRVVGSIGTLVLIRKGAAAEGRTDQSIWKGLWRVKVDGILSESPYVRVRFSRAEAVKDTVAERSDLMIEVFGQIDEFMEVIPGIPQEIIAFLKNVDTPGKLADLCAYSPFFTRGERLDLLGTLDPDERLRKVHRLFEKQLESLKMMAKTASILECATCMDLADRAFESGPRVAEVAREFLDHVVREHPDELLALIAERYGPAFMRRRALK